MSAPRFICLIVSAAFILAACAAEMSSRSEPGAASCAPESYAELIGQPSAAADAIPEPKRILPPNSAVTMDFLAERANVFVDDDGVITRITCG